jgi:RNA polymerase sigma factor (sigma-70 family)
MFFKSVTPLVMYLSFVSGLNSPQKIRTIARENYRLVPYFAKPYVKKYNLKRDQKEELIQYGYEGFMKACEKYDETRGFRLSTYSRFWICKYMDDYIKDKRKHDWYIPIDEERMFSFTTVQTPNSILNVYKLHKWEKELLRRKYHNKDTFLSISKDLNISRDTLRARYRQIYNKIRAQSLY